MNNDYLIYTDDYSPNYGERVSIYKILDYNNSSDAYITYKSMDRQPITLTSFLRKEDVILMSVKDSEDAVITIVDYFNKEVLRDEEDNEK